MPLTPPQSLRIASPGRIQLPAEAAISLTDVESQIFTLLDGCTQHMKQEKGIITACRVAGGWARDKLLGSESNDIDIALMDMMGVAFAEHLVPFLEGKGIVVTSIAKVERNPEQSKHLETGKVTVLGRELDLVNLRSEEYAEDSRIPTEVKFGTPLEDALRRDITINTLFYNVHTHSIEDFTEKGLADLRDGVIRTPLPPLETLRDDPLRVIRCIRFASRFGFTMDPELEEAARLPEIHAALALKISRERIGEEIHKMVKGRDPLHSIQLINSLCLYSSIFFVPPSVSKTFSSPLLPPVTALTATSLLHTLIHPQSSSPIPPLHASLLSASNLTPSTKARLFLAAALTPFKGIKYPDSKKKERLAVEVVIREGLKLGTQNHYLDGIPMLFHATELLKDPILEKGFAVTSPRLRIGLLLRDKTVHNPNTGSHWATSLLFSLVQELVHLYNPATDVLQVGAAVELVNLYNTFVNKIEDMNLPSVVNAKPLLDGREIVQTLGVSRPGSWTGRVLSKVVEWQLEYPDGGKEECKLWLKGELEAGRINVNEEGSGSKRGMSSADRWGGKKAKR